MLVDSAVVVAHVMTPSDLEVLLPPLTEDWRNFVRNQVIGRRWVSERDQDRRVGPQQWIAGISAADPQPTLYYLHALLPHEPYIYLPTGQLILDGGGMAALRRQRRWANDEWAVAQIYQRHLLQVRYVDRLVGELVAAEAGRPLGSRARGRHRGSRRELPRGPPVQGRGRRTWPTSCACRSSSSCRASMAAPSAIATCRASTCCRRSPTRSTCSSPGRPTGARRWATRLRRAR